MASAPASRCRSRTPRSPTVHWAPGRHWQFDAATVFNDTYYSDYADARCPPEILLGRLQGHYDYGDGRKKEDDRYMIFSKRNCNYPQYKYAVWFLSQFRRWGLVGGDVDYQGVAKQVMRPDLYEEAMKEVPPEERHKGPPVRFVIRADERANPDDVKAVSAMCEQAGFKDTEVRIRTP